MWISLESSSNQMSFEAFGGVHIFRPRSVAETAIRVDAERHLRSRYEAGKYTSKRVINEILQHQFAFFTDLLDQLLLPIASLDLLRFVLYQYDESARIETLYKDDQLSEEEKQLWSELGPEFRRTAKYLAERIVLFAPQEAPSAAKDDLLLILEKVWICVEELVSYYVLSDQTFMIFPESTALVIFPEGEYHYWTLDVDNQCALAMQERVRVDTVNRGRFISGLSFDRNLVEHEKVLAEPFRNTIGISYHEAIGILKTLIDGAEPPEDGFPIPFIHFENTCAILASGFGFSLEAIKRTLRGFSISRPDLESEGREIWKPKQEYRAFRRGFFEVEHSTGTHLIFSKEMAKECVLQLIAGVVFRHLPLEWRSQIVESALEILSNQAGKWFESVVLKNLESAGVFGAKSLRRGIGQGEQRMSIPPHVGEIDYLGYSSYERLLVIAECKMVSGSTEPKFFRDEIGEFVTT